MRRLAFVLFLFFCCLAALYDLAPVKYGSNPGIHSSTTVSSSITKFTGRANRCFWYTANGGSIADFKAQIDYFRQHYTVIAMDRRDQGRTVERFFQVPFVAQGSLERCAQIL